MYLRLAVSPPILYALFVLCCNRSDMNRASSDEDVLLFFAVFFLHLALLTCAPALGNIMSRHSNYSGTPPGPPAARWKKRMGRGHPPPPAMGLRPPASPAE